MAERRKVRFKIDKHLGEAELITEETVKIKDVSMGGIRLETTQYLDAKNKFKIELISNDNERINPACELAWASLMMKVETRDGTLTVYDVGLKFLKLTEKEKHFLEKYISEALR